MRSPRIAPAVWLAGAWLVLLVAAPTAAQSRLPLDEAVRSAVGHHPSVGASRASADRSRAAIAEATAPYYPRLTVGTSATRYEEPTIVTPIHGFEPDATPPFDDTVFTLRSTLSYTLFDGGIRSADVRSARARADASEVSLTGAEQEIVARTASAYLSVLGERDVLDAHDRRLSALEAEHDRVRRLLGVGRAARLDLLRVEAAIAAARAERERSLQGLELAERELARTSGLPLDRCRAPNLVTVARPESTALDREAALEQARTSNPELRRSRRERAAAEAGVDAARGARWPTVEVVGDWYDRGGASTDFTAEWEAGLRITHSLFTGGEIGGRIDRFHAALRYADESVRLIELAVSRDVDRAIAAIAESDVGAASLAAAVARYAEVVRVERLRLETGTGTQTDYLDAEADLLVTRARLAEAEHASISARVELARVTGSLGPDWVDENLEDSR